MAKSIQVSIEINASIQDVWSEVSNIKNHTHWMSDAENIEFLSNQIEGVGTKILVLTKIGPLTMNDLISFTKWEKNAKIEVEHEGIVTGKGVFLLEQVDYEKTKFSWSETLKFPIILGGIVGEVFGKYILERIWRKNLKNLKEIIEA